MDGITQVTHLARSLFWVPEECDDLSAAPEAAIDSAFKKKKSMLRDLRTCAAEQRVITAEAARIEADYTIARSELVLRRAEVTERAAELEAELAQLDTEAQVLQDSFVTGATSTVF